MLLPGPTTLVSHRFYSSYDHYGCYDPYGARPEVSPVLLCREQLRVAHQCFDAGAACLN